MAQASFALGEPARLPVVADGDAAARPVDALRLRRVFDDSFAFVWRSLRRLGLEAADADDAAQQVFLVLARRLDEIEPGKERSYLYGVALRVVADVRRTHRRRREVSAEAREDTVDPGESPDSAAGRVQARALLDVVLDQMDLSLRSVFVLFELEELGTQEIADMLEVPVGTVASRLRRARESFQAIVKRMQAGGQLPGGKP